MIGSSAARHATLTSSVKVCLIGPSEPKERSKNTDRDIYGSYYDEGRITRSIEPDPMCRGKLATESVKRYREIEDLSGIKFYDEVGCLSIGKGTDTIGTSSESSPIQAFEEQPELLSKKIVDERFNYLKFPDEITGVVETKNAGIINPRKLVQAQQKLAVEQGCTIIDDVVCDVDRIVHSDQTYVMKVVTETGDTVLAKFVLLCTGAFTKLRNMLPQCLNIQHTIAPLTVALVEVDMKLSSTQVLRDMPCVVYYGDRHEDWNIPDVLHADDDIDFYMLPPIKYPDGVQFKSWIGDSCAIMTTPTSRPYIDKIHDQLGVAVGCNGHAAKSSDEIGRLGATMMLQGWSSDIPQHYFKLKFDNQSKL
ncbi:hypothetical protein ACF0H5_003666 [Mactra antiquata]